MTVNATPGCTIRPWVCPCDRHAAPPPSSRLHTFWSCPVAVAVRGQLAAALGFDPPRWALWLLLRPSPAVGGPTWRLVSLAALDSMEWGRRRLWATAGPGRGADPGPAGVRVLRTGLPAHMVDTFILPHIAAAHAGDLTAVCNLAVARFWTNLSDFVADHQHEWPIGPSWDVTPTSPFLYLNAAGSLALNIPGDAAAPAAAVVAAAPAAPAAVADAAAPVAAADNGANAEV
jgi:hypothetical protein